MIKSPIRLWSFPLLTAGLVLLGGAVLAPCQTPEMYPSAMARSSVGTPRPNVDLPANVPAPDGQLTFYADFAARGEMSVPLYLVNRTHKAIEFSSQDGDPFVKLEHQLEDKMWERAQAHMSSGCGNSYYPISLLPGQHFKFSGYLPSNGTKARVRYASPGNLIFSNEGEGFYLQQDVEDARLDSTGRYVSQIIDVFLRPMPGDGPEPDLTPQLRVVAVRLLQAWGPNPYYQKAAADWAERWEKKLNPSPDEVTAARTIRGILAEPWPVKPNPEALLARCIEALSSGAKREEFGRPENHPVIVWRVLRDLAATNQIKNLSSWKPFIDFYAQQENPVHIAEFMGLAAVPRLADELIANSFFEKHLFNEDPFSLCVCADALSRRHQFERLVEIGWKLKPESQIAILKALAYPSTRGISYTGSPRRPNYGSGESTFWKHCMEMQPLEAAYMLRSGIANDYNPFDRAVHDPLQRFLMAEAEKGAAAPEDYDLGMDGPKLRLVVQFFASWDMKEDNPVLTKLLEHRGFEKSEGSSKGERYVEQRFEVRAAAKRALLQRGQPARENLVLDQRIPR